MYGAQFIVLRSIIFIGLFIGNNNSSGISANNYWLITTLWSHFFGLTTFRTCSIIFPTTVFVLFPNINYSLFWMKTLQNFGCFPFECRWGTFIYALTKSKDRWPVVSWISCSGEPLSYNRVAQERLREWLVSRPSNCACFIIFFATFPKVSLPAALL